MAFKALNTSSISEMPRHFTIFYKTLSARWFWFTALGFYAFYGVIILPTVNDLPEWFAVVNGLYVISLPLLFFGSLAATRSILRKKSWKRFAVENELMENELEPSMKLAPPGVLRMKRVRNEDPLFVRIMSFAQRSKYVAEKDQPKGYALLGWYLGSPLMRLSDDTKILLYVGRFLAGSFVRFSFSSPMLSIVKVNLPKSFSHVMLDGMGSKFEVRPPSKFVSYELEGNFSHRFKLWFEEAEQVQALSLITPDVMQALEDIGQEFDVEIIGDQLYIYSAKVFGEEINSLVQAVEVLLPEIEHKAKSAKNVEQPNHYYTKSVRVKNYSFSSVPGIGSVIFFDAFMMLMYGLIFFVPTIVLIAITIAIATSLIGT